MPKNRTLQEEIAHYDKGFSLASEYAATLSVIPNTTEWYGPMLLALLKATIQEYKRLKRGIREDRALLAWACRNLIELNVFVKYVLQSKTNAKEFHGHRLVDSIHIFEAGRELQRLIDPGRANSEMDAFIKDCYKQKQKEGITTRRYLDTGQLAKKVSDKKAAEYETLNRICSKLVHPTAFSVMTAHEPEVVIFNLALFRWGGNLGLEIFGDLQERFHKLGIGPR